MIELQRPRDGLCSGGAQAACPGRGPQACRAAAMAEDPHALFEDWFAEARASEPNDPEAMALATADADGRPSVRMVLLKGHDERGFAFYTNEREPQGRGARGQSAARRLLFHWKSLRRQVRVEGRSSRSARPNPTPISPPARATPDRRLGLRPVAPARKPRRLRGALREAGRRVRGQGGRPARLTGAAIGWSRTGSNSGPTGRTGCTSGGCSPSARTGWTEGLLYP